MINIRILTFEYPVFYATQPDYLTTLKFVQLNHSLFSVNSYVVV